MKSLYNVGTLIALIIITIFLISASCEESTSPSDGNGKIKIGSSVELAKQSIGTSGGTITVSKQGDTLDGLKIVVSPNALTETKEFSISYSVIESHNLGSKFHPISPLIKISNGGEYATSPIILTIPVKVTEGHIAAAFFYDSKSGIIEAIPVIKYDLNSITIATANFAFSGFYSSKTSIIKKNEVQGDDDLYSNIVISSIPETELQQQNIITTGFEPGIDDWEFTNYGSIISPDGNCGGHSLTALWYYTLKKPNSKKQLYHLLDRYDKNAKPDQFWQDNPKGMKFVSMVQVEQGLAWHKLWNDFYQNIRSTYQDSPDFYEAYSRAGIKASAAQMYITGEPQYTMVSVDAAGSKSHAVVAYQINYNEGIIKVADPNFPSNKDRYIEYVNNTFKPYISGDNANDPNNTTYTKFAFFGKSALYNWQNVGYHWSRMENGTVGSEKFPIVTYTYIDKDGKETDLPDVLPCDEEHSIKIKCAINANGNSLSHTYLSAYFNGVEGIRSDENVLEFEFSPSTELKTGEFGLWVWEFKDGYQEWIDYKVIKFQDLLIEPSKLNGEKNVEYSWNVIIPNPPQNARYEWNFGDGTALTIVKNNTQAKHTYKENGIYPIILEVYDDTKNQFVGVATAYANIGQGIINKSYLAEFGMWIWTSDKPTYTVNANGIISAKNIEQISELVMKENLIPYTVMYKAEAPTDVNIEIDFTHDFVQKKFTLISGNQYGLIKTEWEFEPDRSSLKVGFDTNNTFKTMENFRCDTLGTKLILKGKLNTTASVYGGLYVMGRYKYKETDYYRETDGTEKTEVSWTDGTWPLMMFGINFNQK